MLDVLELDPVRAPDEEGERVRRVDEVGDLDAERLGLGLCSATESTSTPRWLSSGRSGSPGRPGSSSR